MTRGQVNLIAAVIIAVALGACILPQIVRTW